MAYQKPKPDHPWKRGFNREQAPEVEDKHKKSVKVLINELAESWDTIEVFTYSYGREGKYILNQLPQSKQAAWLVGLLKRSYEKIQL